MNIKGLAIAIICISIFACKSDQNNSNKDVTTAETGINSEATNDGHNHAGHDHSSHSQSSANTNNTPQTKGAASTYNSSPSETKGQSSNVKTQLSEGKSTAIPDPCGLISESWIRKNTSLKFDKLNIKEGARMPTGKSRSCFVQWDYQGDPNAGFLVNIMTNPVPSEIDAWPSTYIKAKRMDGESDVDGEKVYPYKVIKGLGKEAVGCYELSKFYFRQNDEELFVIAFNLPINDNQKQDLVVKIGNEVLKNYYSK